MKKNYTKHFYAILVLVIFQLLTANNLFAQYCIPANIESFNTNYISNVSIGTINNSSSGSKGGYTYYSSIATADVVVGTTLKGAISVTMDGWNTNQNTVVVWVNFNGNTDEDFEDDGERFLFPIQDNRNVLDNKIVNVPISILIPNTASLGLTRVRIGFRTGNETNFTSCDYKWQAGEIEDYKINLTSSKNEIVQDPVSSTTDHQATYCTPKEIGEYNINYISNVNIGSINKTTIESKEKYTDYSASDGTDAFLGETLTGTVSVTMNGWNTKTNKVIIWINFNESTHNNFNENTERFVFNVTDANNIGGNKTIDVPISVPVPSNAEIGLSRMRIAYRTADGNNDYTACYFGYEAGEIEDYNINILAKKEDDSDYFESPPPSSATLYFNGKDNYVSGDSFINGLNDVTIMAWVKSDKGNSTDMVIAGEDMACQLSLKSGNKPVFTVSTAQTKEKTAGGGNNSEVINFDEWHHIAGTFSSSTGILNLYIDGILVNSESVGKNGNPIIASSDANKTFEIGRFSNKLNNNKYFKGNIDEVRVFNISLTEDQIKQMVYQEIVNNSGKIKGNIGQKNIEDLTTGNTLPWTNLFAYYPMTDIKDRTILDYSGYNHNIKLYNLKTIQEQTAPMPYITTKDGDLTDKSTWLHGDVWDIKNMDNNKDWSVVKIANNVTIDRSLKTSVLIIDAERTLTVKGDNLIENNWYLELNGTLDLLNDSQLIQTMRSDLVTSANGKILRRQEGTTNAFWYNYWGSPVGAISATTLSNNNSSTNNPNNSNFRLELLKDGEGINMQFTTAYSENNSISTYWLNTFKNGVTYSDWSRISKTTNINPGIGYTQKGSGTKGLQQPYIFEGKPNNGTILIDVKDKGGPGSVPSVSETSTLLGNPYPSALSVYKFIDDNEGVISGKLQLWQQWSGNSHNLSDYNGGYAVVNKLGSVRAYQFVGLKGATIGSQGGTLTPGKYLAIGQGFLVEVIADGKVKFNNGQRMFIKESNSTTDKGYDNGSVFFKTAGDKTKSKTTLEKRGVEEEFKKIRLELNSIKGPATKRELLLGFSDFTSDDYNYGYDAGNSDINNNDIHLNLNGIDMDMKAYSQITNDKVVSLNFKSSASNSFEIKMSAIENIEDSQDIYLKDNFTGTYFNLKDNKSYSFTSEKGKFNERFEIVFQSEEKSLGVEEINLTQNFIYYKNSERKLFAKKLEGSVTKLAIVNMLGQTTAEFNNVSTDELNNGLNIPNMASGAYLAYFRTDTNQVLTKKIIIN